MKRKKQKSTGWIWLRIWGKNRGLIQGKVLFIWIWWNGIYYFVEVALVLLIIQFGQKATEVKLGKESAVPFGGIAAALTWGMFHFVSRGVGIEWWNGISCMLFSVLSGIMYLRLRKNYIYSYFFIAIGYLL